MNYRITGSRTFQILKHSDVKAFAYIDKPKRAKLVKKTVEGILLGYDYRSKGNRIYTGNNKVMISRIVKFIEEGINDIKENENNTQTPIENVEIDQKDDD